KQSGYPRMRLGLIGGTFDPVHYGHLVAAEEARYELGLSKVVFVPAGQPPHKPDRHISPAFHRVAMVRLALASNPHFELSTMEVERSGPSYTVDTVKEFRYLYDRAEIWFITGADAVLEILAWYRAEELFRLCRVVAAARPGYSLNGLSERLAPLGDLRERIDVLKVPGVAVSSTEIRERVKAGKPIKYLLPEAVEEYITLHKLYLNTDDTPHPQPVERYR
ncbi:MAG: nicotinate-nucleotide adenylyltransferase, partial [Alicyclobacillus sp.]|nr:nicotinate-nucleotide adenylyltransferase [Alicyclobacillus sp.]